MITKHLIRLTLMIFVMVTFATSCKREESIYFEYKKLEFTRHPDTAKTFMLYLQRIKYDKINDSVILFALKTDSIKEWDTYNYKCNRGIIDSDPKNQFILDSIQKNEDREFQLLKQDLFYFPGIDKKTKVINLMGVDDNDTLLYETKKEFNALNLYSFYYRFDGFDGDYRLFLADSIGPVAFYPVAWKTLMLLEKVKNSKDIDSKWQKIKYQLLRDTLFFPIPSDLINEIRYIPPYKPK